jgi:hypothetical protein
VQIRILPISVQTHVARWEKSHGKNLKGAKIFSGVLHSLRDLLRSPDSQF